jgi:CMP-N-acetylneuraminic acid synthetase
VRHRQQTLPKYFNDSSNTLYPTPLIIMHKLYRKKCELYMQSELNATETKQYLQQKRGDYTMDP